MLSSIVSHLQSCCFFFFLFCVLTNCPRNPSCLLVYKLEIKFPVLLLFLYAMLGNAKLASFFCWNISLWCDDISCRRYICKILCLNATYFTFNCEIRMLMSIHVTRFVTNSNIIAIAYLVPSKFATLYYPSLHHVEHFGLVIFPIWMIALQAKNQIPFLQFLHMDKISSLTWSVWMKIR